MPLNSNDLIDILRSGDASLEIRRSEYSDEIIVTDPYCPPGQAYFVPAGSPLDNSSGVIVTYTGDAMAGGVQQISREMLAAMYEYKTPTLFEYSVITMGSEGEYLPILFDEEWV
jgi:hypothetical protein